jgi:hypothetical protein
MPLQSPTTATGGPDRLIAANDAPPNAIHGSPRDPVMAEARRLMEAFIAIEDAGARAALIALAERLVSYDWVRRVQPR